MMRLVRIVMAIGLLQALATASLAQERPKLEKATLDAAAVTTRVILQDRVRVLIPKFYRR